MTANTKLKIAIAILGAIGYFLFQNWTGPRSNEGANGTITVEKLNIFYDGANDEYFGGRLKKAIITLDDHAPDEIAYSTIRIDGTPLIHFNFVNSHSERYSYLTLVHEMCHVESAPLTGNYDMDHGRKWKTCMLRVDMAGANRRQLIDGYYAEGGR